MTTAAPTRAIAASPSDERPAVGGARHASAIRLSKPLEERARAYAGDIGLSLNAFISVAVFSCVAAGVPIAAHMPTGSKGADNRQLIRLSPGISDRVRILGRDGETLSGIVCRCVAGYVAYLDQARGANCSPAARPR